MHGNRVRQTCVLRSFMYSSRGVENTMAAQNGSKMHAYAVWTEGGGSGKTTSTAALAHHHAANGLDVLVVDLDGQKGGLTYRLGLRGQTQTANGFDGLDFLTAQSDDPLDELIAETEGFDVLPHSPRYRDLEQQVARWAENAHIQKYPHKALRALIEREELHTEYDLLLTDVPGGIDNTSSRMGIFTVRNILIPFKPSKKGIYNLDGVVETITNLKEEYQIPIGVVGVLPYHVKNQRKAAQESQHLLKTRLETYVDKFELSIPVINGSIGEREALIDNSWGSGSIVQHVKDQSRTPDRYQKTINTYEQIADEVLYRISGGKRGAPQQDAESAWVKA